MNTDRKESKGIFGNRTRTHTDEHPGLPHEGGRKTPGQAEKEKPKIDRELAQKRQDRADWKKALDRLTSRRLAHRQDGVYPGDLVAEARQERERQTIFPSAILE